MSESPAEKRARLAAERLEAARTFEVVADTCIRVVMGNAGVWAAAAASDDPVDWQWPLSKGLAGYEWALAKYGEAAAINALSSWAESAEAKRDEPMPTVDTIMRVVLQSLALVDRQQRAWIGQGQRPSITRELKKLATEREAEQARKAGPGVVASFKAAGLSKSAAYRADKRARGRAGRK